MRRARVLALLVMLVSASFLTLGTVLMKGLRNLDVFSQQGWMTRIGLLPLLAISLVLEPQGLAQLASASWVAWAGAVYAAIPRHPVVWTTLAYVLATTVTGNPRFYRHRANLDIGGGYRLTSSINFFFAARNVFNEPYVIMEKVGTNPAVAQFYEVNGINWTFGVKSVF